MTEELSYYVKQLPLELSDCSFALFINIFNVYQLNKISPAMSYEGTFYEKTGILIAITNWLITKIQRNEVALQDGLNLLREVGKYLSVILNIPINILHYCNFLPKVNHQIKFKAASKPELAHTGKISRPIIAAYRIYKINDGHDLKRKHYKTEKKKFSP